MSSSPLSFFLPFLSQLGTLFKHLYTLDLCFQLFYWFFRLFFNLPTTSLPFRDHPLRLVGIQFWVFLLVPAVCPGSLELSWSRQKSQITTLPLGTLHPWAALYGSQIPQMLESSREAGLRDWLINKAWQNASLGSLGFLVFCCCHFCCHETKPWGKELPLLWGSEDPSVCSFTCSLCSRCQHKPLPQAARVESIHLFSWKPESSSGHKPHKSSSRGTHCAHAEGSWLQSYPLPAHLTHGTSCFALWVDDSLSSCSQVPQSRHS